MDNYIVSARKYRPSTFRSVIGQEALTTTLKNAIATNKLAHAYLFCGPRGVGKTTCARIFAKTINCLNPADDHEACNECESCVAFNEQRSYNIHELDAASNNSVDDIRSLIDQVRIPPQIGRYKVYIIDEVHMLSTAAFNSFLKTLEEPPAHAIFILATTEKHKIIPTILSRCQVYDFNRINISDIVNHLQYVAESENIHAEPEALNIIAQKADGGMRDALSIFDQTASYTAGNVTYKAVIENLNVLDYEYYFRLTDAILQGSVVNCLLLLNDIINRGFEGQYIVSGITSHFRDLLVCKDPVTVQLFEVGASIKERYVSMAQQCSIQFLYSAIELCNDADLNYRLSKNKRLLIELTFIKLCQLNESPVVTPGNEKVQLKPVVADNTPRQVSVPASVNEPAPVNYPAPEIAKEEQKSSAPASQTYSKKKKKDSADAIAGLGVSLSSLSKKKKEKVAEAVKLNESVAVQNSSFTQEDLSLAWDDYANSLTEEVLLKNTMQNSIPAKTGDASFVVEVGTEINKSLIDEKSVDITSFLRNRLANSNIEMSINISDAVVVKRPMTSIDIFDDFVKQNPSLQILSDEFDLEIV